MSSVKLKYAEVGTLVTGFQHIEWSIIKVEIDILLTDLVTYLFF